MITLDKYNGTSNRALSKFTCLQKDVVNLPTNNGANKPKNRIMNGSLAYVMDTSTTMVFNEETDTWVVQNISSGGGSGGGSVDLSDYMKLSEYASTVNQGNVKKSDSTLKVEGIDNSNNSTYYGKNSSGNIGFHPIPTSGYNPQNKDVLDKLTQGTDDKLQYNGVNVEQYNPTNKDTLDKLTQSQDGKLLFNGQQIGYNPNNKTTLEKLSESGGKLLFEGKEITGGTTGSCAVDSINGQTGTVTITAESLNAVDRIEESATQIVFKSGVNTIKTISLMTENDLDNMLGGLN